MLKVWKNRAEMYIGNTIEYDTKAHQFIMTIVEITSVQLKGLMINRSQKSMLAWPTSMWRNEAKLKIKQSRKQFQFEQAICKPRNSNTLMTR